MEYTIEMVQPNDADQVLEFLKSSFMKEEPMYKTLDLLNDSDSHDWPLAYLPLGRSFKAVNSRGEIIAVLINTIEKREDRKETRFEIDDSLTVGDIKIRSLVNHVESQFNLFEFKPNIDQAVELKVLSVSPACRGLGIGKKLFDYSFDWVKTEQVTTVVYCMCSSYFSAQVCEKYGMELVYRLPYADYVVDGENPILPEHPHVAIQIYVSEV